MTEDQDSMPTCFGPGHGGDPTASHRGGVGENPPRTDGGGGDPGGTSGGDASLQGGRAGGRSADRHLGPGLLGDQRPPSGGDGRDHRLGRRTPGIFRSPFPGIVGGRRPGSPAPPAASASMGRHSGNSWNWTTNWATSSCEWRSGCQRTASATASSRFSTSLAMNDSRVEIGALQRLERSDFPALLEGLKADGYKLIGPTAKDGAVRLQKAGGCG